MLKKVSASLLHYLSIVLVFISFSSIAKGKVLFEGYYKITLGQQHIGYVIQRYEFLKKEQQYQSIYFVKTSMSNTQTTESLNALATKDFRPVSYQYTYRETSPNKETNVKLIDAKFKNLKMKAILTEGELKKGKKLVKKGLDLKIKKDSILSTFLIHKILATGLKSKTNYPYNAIAEEEGNLYSGSAKTVGVQKINGKDVFKISNDFKTDHFNNLMDSFGHVYSFETPKIKLKGQLVKKPAMATNGIGLDKQSVQALFNNIPSGTKNNFYK